MGTELTVKESYEVAKSVCSGVKMIISSFKREGIIRKNEIKILQDDLRAVRSARRMQNTNQLFIFAMDKIDDFMKRYDIDNMRPEEAKIFYANLEKLNDRLNDILDDFSKELI